MITLYLVDRNGYCWIMGKVDDKGEQENVIAQWKHDFPERKAYIIAGDAPLCTGNILKIKDGRLELDNDGFPLFTISEENKIKKEIDDAKERILLEMIHSKVSPKAQEKINQKLQSLTRSRLENDKKATGKR